MKTHHPLSPLTSPHENWWLTFSLSLSLSSYNFELSEKRIFVDSIDALPKREAESCCCVKEGEDDDDDDDTKQHTHTHTN